MKNLIVFAFLLLVSVAHSQDKKSNLTPEQRAELKVKKLVLELDLNEKQAKEISTFLVSEEKKNEEWREKMKASKDDNQKMTDQERFELRNKMLDSKIAEKREFKRILNEEQFAKWEKITNENRDKAKNNMKLKAKKRALEQKSE